MNLPSSLPMSAVPAEMATILACGAWMKNAACLLQGDVVHWSPLHGDLDHPDHCIALEQSVQALLAREQNQHYPQKRSAIAAVAHDMHPDFFSTRLALRMAAQLGVPAIAVQHHHAHIAAALAEHGEQQAVIGVALDGVGLGSDGAAWGGELLLVDPTRQLDAQGWRRLGHLQQLALPGGDAAARQPWRMAAAALALLGRTDEIGPRFAPVAGDLAARTVQTMLARGIYCPPTSSAGRWFDAAAAALGLCARQQGEAEAAIALEQMASVFLTQSPQQLNGSIADSGATRGATDFSDNEQDRLVADHFVLQADGTLDLRPLLATLFALGDNKEPQAIARGAALFHVTLAAALAQWADQAARAYGIKTIALGGGCFMNRILRARLCAHLQRRGLRVLAPQSISCGDAGLALGQAWVARRQCEMPG
ncbi:MAG: hydrogenase maturation protein HypF [Janthinobacterium sp.]|jgi:hydrogenase maturation protein HypF